MSTIDIHTVIAILDAIFLPTAFIMSIIALIMYGSAIRKPTVFFLRNLAVADLLIPVGIMVSFVFTFIGGCWTVILHATFLYIGAVSVNAVLAMVLEQLVKFLFPAREIFTTLRLAVLFLALWILPAFLLFVVPAVSLYADYTKLGRGYHASFCSYGYKHFEEHLNFVIRTWIAYCAICLLAVIGMYVYIYLIVRKVFSGGASRIHRENEDSEARTRMQMLKLTVWLLVCLLVFWGPLLIALVIFTGALDPLRIDDPLLLHFIVLFSLLNPIVDPIIILLRMPDVKKRYRAVCCFCCDVYRGNLRGNLPDESFTYTTTMQEQVELPEM